jgi:hypothetical protein
VRLVSRNLWQRIGRRGCTLGFLAVLDAVYALSLAKPPAEAAQSQTIRFISDIAPLWAWAGLWAVVGIGCAVGAFVRHDHWAFVAAVGLKVLWGSIFAVGWALNGLDRGWVSGVVWLAFAGFVFMVAGWPEPGDAAVTGERR